MMDFGSSDSTLNAATAQAMLFCPPQPPVRIQPGIAAVIGRHHSCDLTVRSDDVSRRHAEVRTDGATFEIEDLSSTNGTFVNGEKIDSIRPLLPGDSIEIGSTLISFCYLEAAMDSDPMASDPGKTVLQLEPRPSEAFRGALSEIPPFALLQVLEMGSKTGILEIEESDSPGRIWFLNGMPVHAESEKHMGFEAALHLVAATRGRFRFEPCDTAVDHTIQASVTELLLEACRLADEA